MVIVTEIVVNEETIFRASFNIRELECEFKLPHSNYENNQQDALFLLLQSALQPLVGFGLLYDFVPKSSIFTLLFPVSHFHLL
jgi:hypothetical protein